MTRRIVCDDDFCSLRTVAGVDVAYKRRDGEAHAAAVVLDLETLSVLDQTVVSVPVAFPYVPGLLSFREVPAAIKAIERLSVGPDLLICDGQGLAHPRRVGLASHLGLLLDRPSIGAAKSRLIGTHAEVGGQRGARTPLYDGSEIVGTVLRTRRGCRPLYVSIGHRVSLATAVGLVLACTSRYRLPEPTRLADRLSKAAGR